jgi:hypothetical protein
VQIWSLVGTFLAKSTGTRAHLVARLGLVVARSPEFLCESGTEYGDGSDGTLDYCRIVFAWWEKGVEKRGHGTKMDSEWNQNGLRMGSATDCQARQAVNKSRI